jgi:D-alanyl-D-alanine carboxypeptidase/D-alanyl-D-alanine-endopeptidase (penicillin-binding protein 4)
MQNIYRTFFYLSIVLLVSSCSIQHCVTRLAHSTLLQDPQTASAHIGIAVYNPATHQYICNYQGDKSFIPASNTKIMTCYAAMKYLGDSLVGLRYVDKGNGIIEAEANGDASFLMADFKNQPVFDFLKTRKKILLTDENWKEDAWGYGWAWNDYNSDYMAERTVMPLYGNLVSFKTDATTVPSFFKDHLQGDTTQKNYRIVRDMQANHYVISPASKKFNGTEIPFYSGEKHLIADLLQDTLHTTVEQVHFKIDRLPDMVKVYSQPTDSLLKIMMHRSDNFFAEQTLLMLSNERLGYMNDGKIIDTLLKTDYKDLPQKPQWVDGSGLSHYNLFSPQDLITVLGKMKSEFNWKRITTIFATGNEGTLGGYYKNYAGKIYAKTGTVSNCVALSGFITTQKGHEYLFSVMVNNHQTSAAAIRRDIEKFITSIIDKY